MPVITLKCPSCGGNLDITPDLDSFACGYCGTQQVVQRAGNTVSLKLIGDAVSAIKETTERIEAGTDRVAIELSIRRLRDDLADVDSECARIDEAIRTLKNDKSITLPGCVGFMAGIPLGILMIYLGGLGFCAGALVFLFTTVFLSMTAMQIDAKIELNKLSRQRGEFDAKRAHIKREIERVRAQLEVKP